MHHTRLAKFTLCAAGLLVLFGCTPAGPTSNSTPAPCQMADLVAPEVIPDIGSFSALIIDTLRPTFEWLPTAYNCEIQGYLVSVTAADGEGVSQQIDDGTTWAMDVNLEPATEYRWSVAAVAIDGSVGPSSPIYTFFTGPACGGNQLWSVNLDAPAMSEVVTVPNPPLDWSLPAVSCIPEDYAFTVQRQPGGTTVLSGNSGPNTRFESDASYLNNCTLYHWWVQPVTGGVVSENHSTSYFVTNFDAACPGVPCDVSTLVAPTPLSPENGAAWVGISPIITWDYAYPACLPTLVFHAQVARDEAFDSLLVYSDEISGGWTTFNPAAVELTDCTTYYWRVAADVSGTLGPYSAPRSFHTDFTGTCLGSSCDVTTLPAPTPVSPTDGGNWFGNYPFMTWDYPYPDCESAVTFHAEVAHDAGFTDIVVSGDISGRYNSFDPAAAQLDDCTIYYWHVAANTAHGRGPYSETRTFRANFTACGRPSPGTINEVAACRSGPSQDYPVQAYLERNTHVIIVARNFESTWFVINRPDEHGECWVSADLVTLEGNGIGLIVRDAPPYTGPRCDIYDESTSCWRNGCRWVRQFTPGGPWICVP